jgi:hypothetical protein
VYVPTSPSGDVGSPHASVNAAASNVALNAVVRRMTLSDA